MTAQLAEVAGATVPAADDALANFIRQYDKPVEKDEHGRAVVANNGNGSGCLTRTANSTPILRCSHG